MPRANCSRLNVTTRPVQFDSKGTGFAVDSDKTITI